MRENIDQVFLLVERGRTGLITDQTQMCSDINARMYQLGNNTQKLTFKHVFNTALDKINKKSSDLTIVPDDTYYLKILAKGKNQNRQAEEQAKIAVNEAQIKIRAKFFNTYSDMRVLSASYDGATDADKALNEAQGKLNLNH
jgi:hypothetical protein